MKKTAVVGFGFMGLTHTINILKNPELELVAIVDKYPENIRKNLTEQVGNFSTGTLNEEVVSKIKIYTDLKDCLAAENPEICLIAVHTNLHYELTKIALNAGSNVFLEKPFCLDVSEGKELIELAAQKQLLLMVGHVVRFMPAYKKLKNWVDTGEFGELKFLSLSRFSGVPAWGQWKEKQQDFGSSGGALFDLVIHDIDFVQWLLGSPESIDSACIPGKLSNHDYVNAMWKYPSGVTAKIEGGNIFHTSFPFRAEYLAGFESASVIFSSNNPDIKVTTDHETTLISAGDAMEGYSGELEYFLECLDKGIQPENCMPESALKTIEICYQHI
ncbi:MAG: Gfo/Idh/MocA family oxidoreductase [Bacteroidetes bacterium]|nr:MAG: Gfo/Idh/MocA family oxidoreductase [Bacteroidota bacterium]